MAPLMDGIDKSSWKAIWERWKQENVPLLHHGFTVAFIIVVMILVGLGVRALIFLSPNRTWIFDALELLETCGAVISTVIFTAFALYTIILRLLRAAKAEWRGQESVQPNTVLVDK